MIPGLGSFSLGLGEGAGLSAGSSASSGPVSISTGGVNFAPPASAARRVVDPMTLVIVGAVVIAAVALKRG